VQDVHLCAAKLGITISPKDEADFHVLLAALHQGAEALDQLEDDVPEVDLERFPREGGRFASREENGNGAWAYKVQYIPSDARDSAHEPRRCCRSTSKPTHR